jgi:hypothetical protein
MDVLILNWRGPDDPLAGGSETYLMEVAKRLSSKYRITLVCRRPKGLPKEEVVDGVRVVRVGGQYTVYLRAALEYMKRGADFVIDNINGIPFFTPLYVRKPKLAIIHHLAREIFFLELPYPLAVVGWLAENSIPFIYRKVKFGVVS